MGSAVNVFWFSPINNDYFHKLNFTFTFDFAKQFVMNRSIALKGDH